MQKKDLFDKDRRGKGELKLDLLIHHGGERREQVSEREGIRDQSSFFRACDRRGRVGKTFREKVPHEQWGMPDLPRYGGGRYGEKKVNVETTPLGELVEGTKGKGKSPPPKKGTLGCPRDVFFTEPEKKRI